MLYRKDQRFRQEGGMMQVAVIGAGVIGCSVALELARRGAEVHVLDRQGEVGHGTTSASCGIVRRFYSTPFMTAMAHEGAGIWADWPSFLGVDDESGTARFERPGMLFIPPEIDERIESIVQHMQALGVDVSIIGREEMEKRFPFFDASAHSPVRRPGDPDFFDDTGRVLKGAVFERDAGYVVSPLLATHNLRVAGEKEGVNFMLGRGVKAIGRGGNKSRFRVTLENDDSLETDVVVNAAGPYSGVVNRMAEVKLPIEVRPLRREVHAVENPAYSEEKGSPVPVVGDLDSGVYFRPETGGRDLIVGSLEPECDRLDWIEDTDAWNASITVEYHERQVMRLMKRFPEVRLGKRRGIASLYDVTLLDWNPVLDKTDRSGFYVAIGTSGSSFKTAPVIGFVMAELIFACEEGHDHDKSPLRVTLPRTGFDLNAGFFSRLRAAHDTSSTVLG
ncbi:MAG: NAD(P)/FAD-dependent oxidoreductase [Planctomycetota bacterium]|jgi:sarcosine oxidase subunit beta